MTAYRSCNNYVMPGNFQGDKKSSSSSSGDVEETPIGSDAEGCSPKEWATMDLRAYELACIITSLMLGRTVAFVKKLMKEDWVFNASALEMLAQECGADVSEGESSSSEDFDEDEDAPIGGDHLTEAVGDTKESP